MIVCEIQIWNEAKQKLDNDHTSVTVTVFLSSFCDLTCNKVSVFFGTVAFTGC